MKKILKKTSIKIYALSLLFGIFAYGFNANGQSCPGYYKSKACSGSQDIDFYLSGQSRSAIMEIGVESKVEVVLKGGYDYILTVCCENVYYPIHFVIAEKEGGSILYDNADDEYLNSIGFSLENTQIFVVSMTLLAKKYKATDFSENRSCVGLNIQFRKTPNIGF